MKDKERLIVANLAVVVTANSMVKENPRIYNILYPFSCILFSHPQKKDLDFEACNSFSKDAG